MRPLGDALAARGFPVRAPRLAGHGTDVSDLMRTRWTDWLASAADALDALATEVPRVAVAGLSMGSLLGLHLAATRPADVSALVCCATPIALVGFGVRVLPFVGWMPAVQRRFALMPKAGGPDVADSVARAASPSYRATPLVAVQELLRLQAVVRRELGSVRQPALLLQGRHDHTVPVGSMGRLRRWLGSSVVECHVLERSWHVLTVDVDREDVARLAGDFLDRVDRGDVGG
jgi:carboxylesterase